MQTIFIPRIDGFTHWRTAARQALLAACPPSGIEWLPEGESPGLFACQGQTGSGKCASRADADRAFTVPPAFLSLARHVSFHADAARFALLYRVLWRLQVNRSLIDDVTDPDMAALLAMEKAVRRDSHKMKAFVRFRKLAEDAAGREAFFAWFEPSHHVVELTAPFFARRFSTFSWMIATPSLTALFTGDELALLPGQDKPALDGDDCDALWRTYYQSTFNPARLKVKAMKSEMPVKYWKNLPEADLIPGMIRAAGARVERIEEDHARLYRPRRIAQGARED